MEGKKSGQSFLIFLLVFVIFAIVGMTCYLYIEKTNSNKKVANLEANVIDMQNRINEVQEKIDTVIDTFDTQNNQGEDIEQEEKTDEDEQKEEIIKVLVEQHKKYTGKPGPEGETDWGTTRFIASDGCIYEYTYDEYNKKTSYPEEEKLEKLSEKLISIAKKTDKKLTDEELKLVKDYVKNVEDGKEKIQAVKSSVKEQNKPTDFVVNEYFVMYNYISNKQIQIDPEIEGGIFYESASLSSLFEIVNKYI